MVLIEVVLVGRGSRFGYSTFSVIDSCIDFGKKKKAA
jgi:hypothetical protein